MDATADLVEMYVDEPVILFAAAEPGDAARPSIQDDAKFKAGLGAEEGKPFRFVWVWDGDNNFVFDLEKDAQIPTATPGVMAGDCQADFRFPFPPASGPSAEYHRGDFRAIQRKFDQLHDAIYSRGGVKPTNAAIDELGKLLFCVFTLKSRLVTSSRRERGKASSLPISTHPHM